MTTILLLLFFFTLKTIGSLLSNPYFCLILYRCFAVFRHMHHRLPLLLFLKLYYRAFEEWKIQIEYRCILPEWVGLWTRYSWFHSVSDINWPKKWSVAREAHMPIGNDCFFNFDLEKSWKLIGGMRFGSSGNSYIYGQALLSRAVEIST